MSATTLGRTLLIANPTAHSGAGAKAAEFSDGFIKGMPELTSSFETRLTTARGDATAWAADAGDYDTLIVLGGDGVIHESVEGLMKLPRDDRPALALIPQGSGNDYARTLEIPRNDARAAIEEIANRARRSVELGVVNGVHFMQTLSFGLDAAIALDTIDKRAEGSKEEGEQLFISSAIKVFSKESAGYPVRYSFDGGPWAETLSLVFAVQVGPTYGGGFRICPAAKPNDGLLDVCHNLKKPSVPKLLFLLALARFGKHIGSRDLEFAQARHIEIEFPEEVPPIQVDGDELLGRSFAIDAVPDALDVLVGSKIAW